jgi:hypothetical protein
MLSQLDKTRRLVQGLYRNSNVFWYNNQQQLLEFDDIFHFSLDDRKRRGTNNFYHHKEALVEKNIFLTFGTLFLLIYNKTV